MIKKLEVIVKGPQAPADDSKASASDTVTVSS